MTLNVSVVIPVLNGELTIDLAIRSVNDQIRPATEIIVVDDASTDATAAVLSQLTQMSSTPMIIIANPENIGPGVSQNSGWSMARGALVSFLDADDVWHPQNT
jgi:glycosyltransferase involved in cell wall biosynthesis